MTGRTVFYVLPINGVKPYRLALKGRNAWAMLQLVHAGKRGCTPINNPAPRWSAYVHNARKFGVNIETIHEKHGGAFPGTHARYVLHDDVRVIGGAK
ncbi:hypothetical protein K3556_15000 [Aliiroseovarius sp. M344]|uniref:winged helix domain-containing protein n=1 Tax=Aliiroseovarius sp. M344 TaxID=2867010 RepID=UPI0021AE2181|nr:hypothetical protein [Aliiroseovarius sp. M344]UWQ14195.1 hypothetical protein K3556_15000 [Aliiroseovarius sp. M344]